MTAEVICKQTIWQTDEIDNQLLCSLKGMLETEHLCLSWNFQAFSVMYLAAVSDDG